MHRIGLILFISLSWLVRLGSQQATPVQDVIRAEALRPNDSIDGRPLPLIGHWNMGTEPDGFSPDYQMRMVDQGHYLLPWFQMPAIEMLRDDPRGVSYYDAAIKRAALLKLPISLVGTQWESLLASDAAYFNLPPNNNPNVVGLDGVTRREVSAFGDPQVWRDVGARWTTSPMMKRLQELYPDPPLVLFISNNEQPKLTWRRAEEDKRYVETYGLGHSDDFKRGVVGDCYITRYRALQEGMRSGLSNTTWRTNASFVGYDAFGPSFMGRWQGWQDFALHKTGRIDPNPLAWDGGSPSFYLYDFMATFDNQVLSPQVEAMNWVFMQKEAYQLNPRFWFEISIWDGHLAGALTDKRQAFAQAGQLYTPTRYGGMVQFGLWLLRPRVAREFRAYRETLAASERYFLQVVEAVDRVYTNPTLQAFWRKGSLVANPQRQHPYQWYIPTEYKDAPRWFMLDTSLDPTGALNLDTQLPVFALALVKGAAPDRQWLLYAHSPMGERRSVLVTIPGYKQVVVDVSVGGSFYLVDERSNNVQPAQQNGPAIRKIGRR